MSSLLIQKLDNLGSDKLPNPEVCMKNLEKFMQNVPCGTIPCLGPKFYKPPHPFCVHGRGGYFQLATPPANGGLGQSPTINKA